MTSLPRMQSSFHALDWAIIAIYLAGHGRDRLLLFTQADQSRSVPAGRAEHGLAAGRVVADGRAQQRHGLPDAALVHDPLRHRARRRHRVVAAAVSVGGARRLPVLSPPELLFGLRVSRGALRRARAHARGGDLPVVAARLDGHGDVCAEPRGQRRHRWSSRSQHHDHRRRRGGDDVHDAGRHPGGDLERRDPVLHHVRRPGRDGRDCVVERAGRHGRDLVERGGGGEARRVAAAHRSVRDWLRRPDRRVSFNSR